MSLLQWEKVAAEPTDEVCFSQTNFLDKSKFNAYISNPCRINTKNFRSNSLGVKGDFLLRKPPLRIPRIPRVPDKSKFE